MEVEVEYLLDRNVLEITLHDKKIQRRQYNLRGKFQERDRFTQARACAEICFSKTGVLPETVLITTEEDQVNYLVQMENNLLKISK
jgi:hypothetical protein